MVDGIETTRTAVAEGVRVRKTVETGPEGTATVTLEVANEADEAATVRLTEPALEAISRADVELDAGGWRTDDAAFEREFDAGESASVGYRLVGVDPERFETLDADPVVERTGPGTLDLADPERSEAVRELVAGERESLSAEGAPGGVDLSTDPADDGGAAVEEVPGDAADDAGGGTEDGADDRTPDAEDPFVEPDDVAVEAAPSQGPEPDADGAASGSGVEAALAGTPAGGVARALLEELREGHVDDETAAALREELEPGRSHDVRIKHLQNQVSDFAAYVEMLEGFVDEHGTLEAAFEGVTGEVATLDRELETVRSDLEGLSGTVERDVGALEADVDGLRDDREEMAARLDRLERQLGDVEERLEDLEAFEERLSGALGSDG